MTHGRACRSHATIDRPQRERGGAVCRMKQSWSTASVEGAANDAFSYGMGKMMARSNWQK
jgi:hypothetical protein